MNVLIIGSEGFIGGYCVTHFLAQDCKVIGLDMVAEPSGKYHYIKTSGSSLSVSKVFRENEIDVLINAAGNGNVPYSMTHPVQDFEANCLDTIHILEAIRKNKPNCKYIHLSSAAVYGNPRRLPIKEDDELKPVSPYGWNKYVSELVCKEYAAVYQLKTAILRPFSVYGAGLQKQIFWDTFQKFRSVSHKIELFGTGKESRDFIHVQDVMKAMDCIIQKAGFSGEIYNVASGEETTIKEAIALFWKAFGKEPNYRFNGMNREGDPLNWRADISNLQQLGFAASINLFDGLLQVTDWMKKKFT